MGLETHLTFLVGILVPVMVWFSCHGSVVPGIKDVQFWYSVAPECKPLGHYFIYSGAGAQGDGGGLSPTDAYAGTFQGLVCLCPIRTQPHVRHGVPVTL